MKQLNPKIPPASAPHPEPSEYMCLVRFFSFHSWSVNNFHVFHSWSVNNFRVSGLSSKMRRSPQWSTPRRFKITICECLSECFTTLIFRWTNSSWPTATCWSRTWTGWSGKRNRRQRKPLSSLIWSSIFPGSFAVNLLKPMLNVNLNFQYGRHLSIVCFWDQHWLYTSFELW